MRNSFFFVFILSALILLNSLSLQAQETSETTLNPTVKPFTVFLDGTAIILSGFGGKALYSVEDYMAFGAIGYFGTLKSDDKDTTPYYRNDYKHMLIQYGAVAEFYLLNQARKAGAYLTLGLTNAHVRTEVDTELFGANSSENSRLGALAAFGWHYTERLTDRANVVFQLGLGYGNGSRVSWTYAGTDTEIQDSVLIDIKAGLQF